MLHLAGNGAIEKEILGLNFDYNRILLSVTFRRDRLYLHCVDVNPELSQVCKEPFSKQLKTAETT